MTAQFLLTQEQKMKSLKNILLISLFAAVAILAGCDQKQNGETEMAKKAKQKTEQTAPVAENQATEQTQTVTQDDAENLAMLEKFNAALRIENTGRTLGEDENKVPNAAFSYTISNVGDKQIKGVKWIFAYVYNGNVIHTAPFGIDISDTFEPQTAFNLNFLIPLADINEEARKIIADPASEIASVTIAREITFADGSQIIVTN